MTQRRDLEGGDREEVSGGQFGEGPPPGGSTSLFPFPPSFFHSFLSLLPSLFSWPAFTKHRPSVPPLHPQRFLLPSCDSDGAPTLASQKTWSVLCVQWGLQ